MGRFFAGVLNLIGGLILAPIALVVGSLFSIGSMRRYLAIRSM